MARSSGSRCTVDLLLGLGVMANANELPAGVEIVIRQTGKLHCRHPSRRFGSSLFDVRYGANGKSDGSADLFKGRASATGCPDFFDPDVHAATHYGPP